MTASLASAWAGAVAQTDKWPDGPVKIVVPFSAGGASDILTRALAEKLQARLGKNFVFDNRTGAGGNIGMEYVKNAPSDGNTIVSATIGTLSINQFLFSKIGYDPEKDFAYVSMIWENCNVFVVSPNHASGAKTVQEFLAWARKQPKGMIFGSAGVGTTPHLSGELIQGAHRNPSTARALPWRDAIDAGADDRRHRFRHRQHRQLYATDPRGQGAGARRHSAFALADHARPADHG